MQNQCEMQWGAWSDNALHITCAAPSSVSVLWFQHHNCLDALHASQCAAGLLDCVLQHQPSMHSATVGTITSVAATAHHHLFIIICRIQPPDAQLGLLTHCHGGDGWHSFSHFHPLIQTNLMHTMAEWWAENCCHQQSCNNQETHVLKASCFIHIKVRWNLGQSPVP